ncbi:MAG TPA: CocE/NonD family hydrolase [candidate division Zixibacteria bacterium]|nr:CocE/NonD family hydrolase [candidate division Zixibacteria bacterium]MDD4917499.1 CocE/NonD family hydrolase [candidate division Zixibacteria bacterium]HPM36571.1 CocE/NonD family hydrolase [candidate division Zixibacteria bacterium]
MNIVKTTLTLVAWSVLFVASLSAQVTDTSLSASIDLLWGVKIPMRDGIQLNATVYKPKGAGPLPVILTLTPYIADTYHNEAFYFAQNGYVFVMVDVRGRGNSQGTFNALRQEANDGFDAVGWIARQSWCDGRIAMYGSSYDGYDQWATAKEFPPNLKTIVPTAAAMPSIDIPFWKNIWDPFDVQWITLTSGVTANKKLFAESHFWIQKYRELYMEHRAFRELDTITGNPSALFQEWLAHPCPDSYWDACNPAAEQFARIDMPILTITGYYDDDQPGAMEFYRRHMMFGSREARARHYIVIGPWDHGGTDSPTKEVGGLLFGDARVLDMNQLHKEWYDWVLKSGQKPGFLEARVAYYVVGKDVWKYADSLEAIGADKRVLYLGSNGSNANDVFHSGYLTEARATEFASDSFVYDPLDTRPAELETAEIENYLTDERYALNLFGNGLVYHTEAFAESTEVSGNSKLVLWISMDVPDADFQATLYEIMPDGKSILLARDRLRARFRESLREERLIKPGEVLKYEFTGFNWFSRYVAKGSRLRLVIACPNSIYLQKNYNSGKNVVEETGNDARTAHIKVYHDATHRSYLELPVGK